MLSFEELKAEVEGGQIDTVVVAFTDMQGRLMGKRLHGEFFVDEVDAGHPVEGCNYLLALEMEMDPVPGYEIASWERGYGDFGLAPDLATLRRIPWLEATALVLCDVQWHDGSPVEPSPRQVLKAQMERAAALGYTPMCGSELEFYLLRRRTKRRTRSATRTSRRRSRTSSTTTSSPPPTTRRLIRQIRNGMHAAGIKVETSKGEAWPGQHEINFRYADAVTMADNHVIYKNGAKEIAHANGCSITFMAKPFESWIGNSCHVHSSLFRDDTGGVRGRRRAFRRLARGADRLLRGARDVSRPDDQLLQALRRGELGADQPRLGARQPHVRVPHRRARRGEARGDADPAAATSNPYLGFAAIIAAGLHGIEAGLRLPPALEGNAYESDAERFPSSMREAIAALEAGTIARGAFGDEVVDHYLNYARTEQALFDTVVTDWERERYFERG